MQQVTNYFALKVGATITALSTAAFSLCGLILAKELSPFIEVFDKYNQRQLKDKTKLWMTLIGAGLGLGLGAGFSVASYLWFSLFEVLSSTIKNALLPSALLELPKP